jgi:hypothetical protein
MHTANCIMYRICRFKARISLQGRAKVYITEQTLRAYFVGRVVTRAVCVALRSNNLEILKKQ